ncbi:hypothetical protein KCU95_g743, partial [Aureobasidium melanogenum]
MRFSIVTIASAAVAAAGTNAIDVAEIPGYEPIPKAATNKYSQDAPSAIPDFATGSFEPTYMPAEDLKTSSIQARSVTSTSATAISSTPVTNEPADDSYEAFVLWMSARLAQEVPEKAEHSHVVRSVAPSPSAKVEASADGPADDTYEGFVTWMESRYPKDFSEQVKQKINARDAEQHTTTSSTTTATPAAAASITGPVDDTYEAFVAWMDSRYPKEFSEQVKQKINARDVASQATTTTSTTSTTITTTVVAATGADPADESYEEFVHWMNSRFPDGYPAEDHHELNARSVDTHETLQGNGHEMPDWSHAWNEEVEHHLQARSAEEENNGAPSDFEYESGSDAHAASETKYPYLEETFEEFMARQGYSLEQYAQESKPSEPHEEEPKPQVAVDSKPSVSEVAASPAAAATPKPTSAITSSATTSTFASQYSGQMSETSTVSSSSATNVQARSVSSHYRFRHHSHSAYASNSGTASTSTSSAISSTTTSRKGFFNLPW